MDALPLTSVSSLQAAFPADTTLPPAGEGAAVRGADFANLLEHLMAPAGRQELAAAGAPALQSLPLSPTFEVITANEPLPDAASLLAFARGQGLDEGMLKSLFVLPADTPATAPGGAGVDSALAAQAGLTSALSTAALLATGGLPVIAATAQPVGGSAGDGERRLSGLIPGVSVLSVSGGAVSAGAGAAAPMSVAAGMAQTAASVLPDLGQTALPGQLSLGQAAPWAAARGSLAQPAQVLDVPAASDTLGLKPLSQLAAASAQEVQATEPDLAQQQAMRDALRVQLQPQEQLTRRLAALAVTGQQAMWGQIADPAAQDKVTILQLGDVPDELQASSGADGTPASSHTPAGTALTEASRQASGAQAQAQPTSTADERAAQYEQLAQRLGQALGQRLQAQIERGQWKVQMQVDPASLGRIDMELDMRAGNLEAVFRSDNQVTRDLIAQGLPKLRESLAQSGTAVANVWVQGDSSRQSGGNPTPGRWVPEPSRSAVPKEEELPVAQAPLASRASSSAWDVLA